MCILGCITMACQGPWAYGGVDENPLTMVYSVYLGLWSISFLNWWTRRENELRFLWGNEKTDTASMVSSPRSASQNMADYYYLQPIDRPLSAHSTNSRWIAVCLLPGGIKARVQRCSGDQSRYWQASSGG